MRFGTDAVSADDLVSRPARGGIAILVVYFLRNDDDLPILALHLDRIAAHTRVPFTVYGAANRVTPTARRMLHARSWLRLCEIEPTGLRGSREHGYYLDALAALAAADGVDRLITLDVDSFPISDDWIETIVGASESGVAGILRVENGDTALPHPSCVMVEAEFFDRYRPSFSPDSDFSPEFRRFLRSTGQAGDTGLGLAYTLWAQKLPWGRLLRSNAVELHPIIAGIYADSVFHLAGVASGTIFRRDLQASRLHRLTSPLERLPLTGSAGKVKTAVLTGLRGRATRAIVERNRNVYATVRTRLLADSTALFAELRGHVAAVRDPRDAPAPETQR